MSIPAHLLYSKTHEWVRMEGDEAVIGLTFFAQEALGDITYVDMPVVGAAVEVEEEFGAVESVKAASDLFSPVSGEVVAVNDALADTPELLNQVPYEGGWIMRVKVTTAPTGLLDQAAYEAFCATQAH
ncbi:MAG: glycine cleavage system protein GcvH [Desulfovibrionaceae bacterium]